MSVTKAELRKAARARLAGVPADQRAEWSAAAVGHLIESELWTSSQIIVGYLAMAEELSIDALWAEADGRTVTAPRADWQRLSMVAARLDDPDEAVEHRVGLREPPASAWVVPIEPLDLVLAPGLAFDAAGGRMGRGGGFYDRFLRKLLAETQVVGVGFECQVVDAVPMEAHDVRVGWMLTETGLRAATPA
ncbi:MAG: 5-formyltetrahydrofolate cyclo-ligase [Planctomycetota bacterium]